MSAAVRSGFHGQRGRAMYKLLDAALSGPLGSLDLVDIVDDYFRLTFDGSWCSKQLAIRNNGLTLESCSASSTNKMCLLTCPPLTEGVMSFSVLFEDKTFKYAAHLGFVRAPVGENHAFLDRGVYQQIAWSVNPRAGATFVDTVGKGGPKLALDAEQIRRALQNGEPDAGVITITLQFCDGYGTMQVQHASNTPHVVSNSVVGPVVPFVLLFDPTVKATLV